MSGVDDDRRTKICIASQWEAWVEVDGFGGKVEVNLKKLSDLLLEDLTGFRSREPESSEDESGSVVENMQEIKRSLMDRVENVGAYRLECV